MTASEEDMIGAMSCASCDQPVVRADEIITERYDSPLSSAVFAYELEVCNYDAWVYSATSASQLAFAVRPFDP